MGISQKPSKTSTQTATHDRLAKSIDDGTKRLNVPIDAALYRRMKLQALQEDPKMADITRERCEGYLERYSAEQ
jgi:hypothetical protein